MQFDSESHSTGVVLLVRNPDLTAYAIRQHSLVKFTVWSHILVYPHCIIYRQKKSKIRRVVTVTAGFLLSIIGKLASPTWPRAQEGGGSILVEYTRVIGILDGHLKQSDFVMYTPYVFLLMLSDTRTSKCL